MRRATFRPAEQTRARILISLADRTIKPKARHSPTPHAHRPRCIRVKSAPPKNSVISWAPQGNRYPCLTPKTMIGAATRNLVPDRNTRRSAQNTFAISSDLWLPPRRTCDLCHSPRARKRHSARPSMCNGRRCSRSACRPPRPRNACGSLLHRKRRSPTPPQ
jgi:hypothetical protein